MYFQVVTIEHSLERPHEELGDVALSPVFRRVSARCPVLHLFGYVHIPLPESSQGPPTRAADSTRSMNSEMSGSRHHGQHLHSDVAPLATLLEPVTGTGTPHSLGGCGSSPAQISPSPKLTARSVRVVEPSPQRLDTAATTAAPAGKQRELDQRGVESVGQAAPPHTTVASSEETLRSSAVLRSRYTQRRCCLHVHGVYPSLLLPQYDPNVSAAQLAAQLETVVVRVLGRQGVVVPSQQLVHDVRLVHRYNVYGYRPHAYAFYLVELIDPGLHQRVVEVLQNTTEVGGRQWQLYDAHMKYHTQFMVHWRINGIAPFPLPVSRCHVRLPTVRELQHLSAELSGGATTGGTTFLNRERGQEEEGGAGNRPLPSENNDSSSGSSGGGNGSVSFPHYCGVPFFRFWRSDELGRLTTAEVELDVAAHHILSQDAKDQDGASLADDAAATTSGHPAPRRTQKATAGDNLSYTRRIIRQYFKEHGVADALRVADTIAMERHLQAKASTATDEPASPSLLFARLRYGNVTQIQRADPAVRWMRHRMLDYLEQRRAAQSAAALSLSTRAHPVEWKTEAETHGHGCGVASVVAAAAAAGSGSVEAKYADTISDAVSTAAQQREQRAMRAQMVADYVLPGGGKGRHPRRVGDHSGATESTAGKSAGLPALQPTYAELGAEAILAMGGSVSRPLVGVDMSAAAGERARYIGYSCDSMQPSLSQDTATPRVDGSQLEAEGPTRESTAERDDARAAEWLLGLSSQRIREAEEAHTQDLFAALASRSSASLPLVQGEASQLPSTPVLTNDALVSQHGHDNTNSSRRRVERAVCDAPAENASALGTAVGVEEVPEEAVCASIAASEKMAPAEVTVTEPQEVALLPSSSWSSWSSWSTDTSLSNADHSAHQTATATVQQEKKALDSARRDDETRRDTDAQTTSTPLVTLSCSAAAQSDISPPTSLHAPMGVRPPHNEESAWDGPTQCLPLTAGRFPDANSGGTVPTRTSALSSPFARCDESNTLVTPRSPAAEGLATPEFPSSSEDAISMASESPQRLCERAEAEPVEEGDEEEKDLAHGAVSRHAQQPQQITGYKRIRFSSTVPTPVTCRYKEGDCVAFVRVRCTPPSPNPPPSGAATRHAVETVVCDVLAVACITGVCADLVELRWFLTLAETHVASDEAALVRRGAWLRLAPTQTVSQGVTSAPGERGGGAPGTVVPIGEMVLSDVVDTLPAHVLDDPRETLAYAASHSAPTQRMRPEENSKYGESAEGLQGRLMRGSGGVAGRCTNSCGDEEGRVRVWEVHCCTDITDYRSRERQRRWMDMSCASISGGGDGREERRHSSFPALLLLCRYEYVIRARVFSVVAPSLFTDATARREGSNRNGERQEESASTPVHAERREGGNASYEGESGNAKEKQPPVTLSQMSRQFFTQPRTTRVLFSQPQVLTSQGSVDGTEAEDETAVTACRPTCRSAEGHAAHHSVAPPAAWSACGAAPCHATAAGGKAEEEEFGEGENTLLFSSSSSSSSRSDGRIGSGSRRPSRRRVDDASARLAGLPWLALLGSSTPFVAAPPQQLTSAAPRALPPPSPCAGENGAADCVRYRITTSTMPVEEFRLCSALVTRSVRLSLQGAVQELQSQEQLRWRQHSSALSLADPSDGEEGEGEASALLPLTPVESLPMDGESKQFLKWEDDSARAGGERKDGASTSASREAEVPVYSLPDSSPVRYTVRDSSQGEAVVLPSLMSVSASSALSITASPADSVDSSVQPVTASQHSFLRLFHHDGSGSGAGGTVLQSGGGVDGVADGVRRLYELTAYSTQTEAQKERSCMDGGESMQRQDTARRSRSQERSPQSHAAAAGSARMRVRVSAVTWPHQPLEADADGTAGGGVAAIRHVPLHPGAAHLSSAQDTTHRHQQGHSSQTGVATTAAPRASGARDRASASHVPGLSLSVTQQPQHYLQCVLRVQYVEVLLNRRPGETLVSTSDVLAVALGQATTAADSAMGVRIFCVQPTRRSAEADVDTVTIPGDAGLRLEGLCQPVQVVQLGDEAALLTRVREEIISYDPDVLLSWEGYKYGLGYLALRYRAVLQRSLAADLSRIVQHHGYQSKHARNAAARAEAAAVKAESPPPAPEAEVAPAAGEASTTTAAGAGAQSVSPPPLLPVSRSLSHVSLSSSASSSAALNDIERDVDAEEEEGDDDGGGERGSGPGFRGVGQWGGRGGGAAAGGSPHHHPHPPQQQRSNYTRLAALRSSEGSSGRYGAPPGAADAATEAVASYSKRFGANVRITGRICTSLGKDLRKDVKLPSYALPMVHLQLFKQPLPYFSDTYLAELFHSTTADPGERQTALHYLAARVVAPHRIACRLHWFTKLLEFSRMYGILTEEVLTRGSQFRVEATLLRLAHPLRYAMLSPSMAQVHRQPRIECIPLVMQPRADLYKRDDPIVVLDFRSLYPSIIIAYNLCYTTCLGMVQPTAQGRLGVLPNYRQRDSLLADLLPDDGTQHDGVVFTPNGAMFVGPGTRVGLLPQMVQAVLDTRFEVQASLKHIAVPAMDTVMQRRLQEQQLALKMLANVTYGYTAASFTGRMPCVDLAEAIVSLGRQTLERAIALIHSTPAWAAEVVYGDTDSLFVRLHGRSLAEAFAIGQQMADAVTQSNPPPIRLQFEKVMSPCVLLVKKRYAGYMWTSPSQTTPTFLAKGIEVVRRDQCPATVTIAQTLLRMLFDGSTAATLKHVYYAHVEKLQAGAVNPLQCVFRRAVKLGRYGHSGDGHLPLAARLALKQMEKDVTETPYWGELLPYVVVRSTHSIDKLTDQVMHPEQLLYVQDRHTLDADYYITRNINSTLDRMFYLVGISFAQWYQAMPRRRTANAALLNLPTFMKAQQQQHEQRTEGRALRSASPPPHLFSCHSPIPPHGRAVDRVGGGVMTDVNTQAAQLQRAGLLASLMLDLLREATDPLFALHRAARRRAEEEEEEVISDEEGGGQTSSRLNHHGGDGRPASAVPVDVEALTQPAEQEAVDVEQLMATQRADGTKGVRGSSTAATAAPPAAGSRVAFRKRKRGGGGKSASSSVTLDAFYPRTLCVVCEREVVSLDDVRRQREVLRAVLRLPKDDSSGGSGAVADDDEEEEEGEGVGDVLFFEKDSRALGEEKGQRHDDTDSASSLLLLPPICTRCWSDPSRLFLHVQERCRATGRQLNTLQHICRGCISSGGSWGSHAQTLYDTAIRDMEDMDAFAPRSVAGGGDGHDEGSAAVGSVPRHLLGAVQLSERGVPRGCVSIDCAVSFEKKWVTEQWWQWQAVQRFLRRVL